MSPNEVCDGHHADISPGGGAPQGTGPHPLLHHGVQRLLQCDPGVQDDHLGVLVQDVVALV